MNSKAKNSKANFLKRSQIISLGVVALLSISACESSNLGSGGSLPNLSLKNPLIPEASTGQVVSSPTNTGIVDRGLYSAVIAGPGDTMATLGARAGVTGEQLAIHNGLPVSYTPRNGQEFAIPSAVALEAIQLSTTDTLPDDSIEASSLGNENTGITTHRVKAGETAYSIARLYGVSVTSLASWNKLGPELSVTEGTELIIPSANTPTQTAQIPSETANDASPSTGFQKPVNGTVSTAYDPSNGSQGVVYSTGGQASVKASSGGKVVLVSESTGANGTIVMVQHPNGLISVYGKLGSANVAKGEEVTAGQTIGTTSGSQLLFQLRKGTASVDPSDYV